VAILFVLEPIPFDLAMEVPEFQALSKAGGAGLMTTKVGSGDPVASSYLTIGAGAHTPGRGTSFLMSTALRANGVSSCLLPLGEHTFAGGSSILITFEPRMAGGNYGCPSQTPAPSTLAVDTPGGSLPREGAALADLLGGLGNTRTLAVVVASYPSTSMDRVGDEVMPLIAAEGPADQLLTRPGPMHALTSDTTRQTGLVSNVDVAPTVLDFFGIPVPSQMDGSVIHATEDPAPFALYRLEREHRRIRVPIQLAEVGFLALAAIVGTIALLALTRRGILPPRVGSGLRFLVLCCVALPIPLVASGLLPHLTYAYVVPFLVLITLALAILSLRFGRADPLGPFTFLGAVGLAFIVVDAVAGGRAFRTPVFGGVMFDGVRYYGLGNAFIPTLLASALLVARRLERFAGAVLLFAVGLFAGFPHLLADIGASITLFAAAGLWWAISLRSPWDRRDWRSWARAILVTGCIVVVGLGVVLAMNRYGPGAPTHATRFVERAQGSLGSALSEIRHRLGVGFSQLNRYPTGYLPMLGLPLMLLLVLKGPGPIGPALRRLDERWRDVLVVLILASLVAYVANDTGVAAAAPAFLYAFAGIAYPAFLMGTPNEQQAALARNQT
jgi:hypothetical protein